jgi:methylthioribose-1-phosphate isomerase
MLAVLAQDAEIPFYVVAPNSTVDPTASSGEDIPIEQREAEEILKVGKEWLSPPSTPVFNPAFDVTPSRYISAIVTEDGVSTHPYDFR